MGRTIHKFRDEDDSRHKNKSAKHSKNIPGKGMRVINNWSVEEDDNDFDENYEGFVYDESDEYYENTSLTQRK
jgi:hypothetical protein